MDTARYAPTHSSIGHMATKLRIIGEGSAQAELERHVSRLRRCRRCPGMIGPVVTGHPVLSPVMLVGQAPGIKEGALGRPFAWTAGKTLFTWFQQLGLTEEQFRASIYMAAVCRCFPGKNPKGGDRVPAYDEIELCAPWLETELSLLRPGLVIPVGKLAIGRFIAAERLDEVVGRRFGIDRRDLSFDLIPLPHPSGASTWHRTDPGKRLLTKALELIGVHRSFRSVVRDSHRGSRRTSPAT